MQFFTDQPETMADFLPAGWAWEAGSAHSLSPDDAGLWAAFGGDATLWQCVCPDAAESLYPDRRVVLIDRAEQSQFDAALEALQSGVPCPDGLIVLALEGARFRGQRNRSWIAMRGNLHLTVQYHVGAPVGRVQPGLTMLPAVAAAEGIRAATDGRARPRIKWINDLLLDANKVAGVLTATHLKKQMVECAVFGLGVNVARAPAVEPTPFVPATGSLASHAVPVPRLLTEVVRALDTGMRLLRADGSDSLYRRYCDLSDVIGRTVRLWPEESVDGSESPPFAEGRVIALNPDLSLQLEGRDTPVRGGRLAYVCSRGPSA